ncbi:ferritin-like domain-containing protein [Cantharellus anzutake]|uniref:ferritin-like domain-containing protein n=1 Tax=Cantharellus anzutake TaxID=1750568 RepID=UPI001904B0C6|nr:ferritin-like domain-containing protein [Cantharellus anzutake]KAF8337434.1 ferritin-like domain-containing protein [Cantharellus anzutake]
MRHTQKLVLCVSLSLIVNVDVNDVWALPFTPKGGVGVRPQDPPPVYHTFTEFDFQSLNLALNQEYIELDLFHNGLARFSDAEFEAAGLNANDRFLIEYMADQEVGHAQLITNMLGPTSAKQCIYEYPFHNVRQFLDFCQKLTRFGESGVYGFLPHLNQRPVAQLLTQSITTEARQQFVFKQFEGAFPMALHFTTGLPQAWAWTMLSPYLKSCPKDNPRIIWQIFPALNITNNPSIIDTTTSGEIVSFESGTEVYYPSTSPTQGPFYLAALSTNRTSLSFPGREVHFRWDLPGKKTSYDLSYTTHSTAKGPPKWALWVSQLNVTYTPLHNINFASRTASTFQPGGIVFPPDDFPDSPVPGMKTYDNVAVNDTMFIALVDRKIHVTPFNLSLINTHVVAGPALYQAD